MHEERQSNLDQRAGGVPSGVTARPVIDPKHGPSICILSLSRVADDPRVRRHGDAFHRAGWNIVAVGFPGARSAAPEWPIVTAATSGDAPARQHPSLPGKGVAVRGAAEILPNRQAAAGAAAGQDTRWPAAAPRGGASQQAAVSPRQLGVWIWPRLAHDIYWSYSADIRGLYASPAGSRRPSGSQTIRRLSQLRRAWRASAAASTATTAMSLLSRSMASAKMAPALPPDGFRVGARVYPGRCGNFGGLAWHCAMFVRAARSQ